MNMLTTKAIDATAATASCQYHTTPTTTFIGASRPRTADPDETHDLNRSTQPNPTNDGTPQTPRRQPGPVQTDPRGQRSNRHKTPIPAINTTRRRSPENRNCDGQGRADSRPPKSADRRRKTDPLRSISDHHNPSKRATRRANPDPFSIGPTTATTRPSRSIADKTRSSKPGSNQDPGDQTRPEPITKKRGPRPDRRDPGGHEPITKTPSQDTNLVIQPDQTRSPKHIGQAEFPSRDGDRADQENERARAIRTNRTRSIPDRTRVPVALTGPRNATTTQRRQSSRSPISPGQSPCHRGQVRQPSRSDIPRSRSGSIPARSGPPLPSIATRRASLYPTSRDPRRGATGTHLTATPAELRIRP